MDEATRRSLQIALEATPQNTALRMILVQGYVEAGLTDEALACLDGVESWEGLAPGDRVVAGRVLLSCGRPENALAAAGGASPEAILVSGRALLALGRVAEAKVAYRRAVAGNPALEDTSFSMQLDARDVDDRHGDGDDGAGEGKGRPKLRVIDRQASDNQVLTFLTPEVEKVTFADVGGLAHLKEQVRRRIILPFQKPTLFERFKKRVGGGLLMYGPPGCGKTLLARATAGECQATFFSVAISDVLDMWLGESEAKLHALFEKARASKPAVVFFDEIEALGGKRSYSRNQSLAIVVSQLLSEMDGFAQGNSGVLILAATNVPWDVDPAFRRPGRFDRTLFVPPPDRDAREAILRIHLKDRPVKPGVDVAHLAKQASGFSGADLRGLIEEAADIAIAETLEKGEEVPIAHAHLLAALREVKATTKEWLTSARNYARYANEGGQYDEVLSFLKQHGKA